MNLIDRLHRHSVSNISRHLLFYFNNVKNVHVSRIRMGKLSAHLFYFFVLTGHHFVWSLLPQTRVLLFSEKEGLKRQLFEEKIIHFLDKPWIKKPYKMMVSITACSK